MELEGFISFNTRIKRVIIHEQVEEFLVKKWDGEKEDVPDEYKKRNVKLRFVAKDWKGNPVDNFVLEEPEKKRKRMHKKVYGSKPEIE